MMDDLNQSLARDLDAAFPAVVDRLGGRLYWGLRRMSGSHQEAEDLTQETLIRAYRALAGYPEDRIVALRLEPWVWTIALNLGRNHVRDRARRPLFVGLDDEVPTTDPEPVEAGFWDERLGHLSEAQRTAVVLRHVVGMGIEEISEATGRPTGTVKADIHRGLNRLREIMEVEV
jgi:RNA polymerase sigma-70 factor (ECF subfamily)